VEDPASFLRALFIEALQRTGVQLDASPLDPNPAGRLPPPSNDLTKVAGLISLPFSEYARLILKVSHNRGANTLLPLMSLQAGDGTYEDGFRVEKEFLQKAGIELSSVALGDGAGGDPYTNFTPAAVVGLLRHMASTPYYGILRNAMPSLGMDGTLAGAVNQNSPARGKAHAKTGTIISFNPLAEKPMLNAKALAGYMTTARGRNLAFAIFVNKVPIDTVQEGLDVGHALGKICEMMYAAQ
jgi:D-alanyl-D-alanine carboxypeptidase/D-alanyl-D-alanine-endopeptidase (penicillin-binding protein 4)